MKRSPLVQGLILLLLAVLVGSALLHRTVRFPKFNYPKSARPPGTPEPPQPNLLDPELSSPGPHPPLKAPESPVPVFPEPPVAQKVEIRGKLVDLQGALSPYMRRTLTRLSVETDEMGAFRVECPVWTRCTFTAQLTGYARAIYPLTVTDPDHLFGTVNDITMSFRGPLRFDGVLTTADGSPAANARLRFHPLSSKINDPAQGAVALNLLNGTFPADEAWDARCRKALFLTDCEVVTNAQGEFSAHSLLTSTTYAIEVERDGQERAVIELHTRGLKDKVKLQIGR